MCQQVKSLAERLTEAQEFRDLVREMREAQKAAERALALSDDYSEALIYVKKAEDLERDVDIILSREVCG